MDIEKYFNTENITDRYQQVVANDTANALKLFCNQEDEFMQAVEQSDKTFQQCLDSICKDIGKSISDMELYKKAVQFYFPTAEINFRMSIDLCGNTGYTPPSITMTEKKPKLSVSLDDLLDF